jgi:pimeloyl-ACP methyl ester carboxylesterase
MACRGATVVGHSIGGSVAIQLAMTRPDLVANLIVGEGNVTTGGGGLVKQIAAHNEASFLANVFTMMQAEIFEGARNAKPSVSGATTSGNISAQKGFIAMPRL